MEGGREGGREAEMEGKGASEATDIGYHISDGDMFKGFAVDSYPGRALQVSRGGEGGREGGKEGGQGSGDCSVGGDAPDDDDAVAEGAGRGGRRRGGRGGGRDRSEGGKEGGREGRRVILPRALVFVDVHLQTQLARMLDLDGDDLPLPPSLPPSLPSSLLRLNRQGSGELCLGGLAEGGHASSSSNSSSISSGVGGEGG